jgi:isochorismate synthase
MAFFKQLLPHQTLQYSGQTAIHHLYVASLVESKRPFALFKLPNSEIAHLMVSAKKEVQAQTIDFKSEKPFFLVGPFFNEKKHAFCIPADYQLSYHIPMGFTFNADKKSMEFFGQLKPTNSPTETPEKVIQNNWKETLSKSNFDFAKTVNEALTALQAGVLSKVVLSRKITLPLHAHADMEHIFLEACQQYPTAMVSLVHLPESGLWLTITPEYLLYADDKKIKTVALAGTKKVNEGESAADVLWSQKEIEEQALVARYIIEAFKRIRLREYVDVGPQTIQAGNLWHLKTEFEIKRSDIDNDDIELGLIHLLHPTAAVCGFPKAKAMEYIMHSEGYDRELYSGYLGPVNFEGKTSVFVNLRCAKIDYAALTVSLYAGAGIIIGSNAEKETEETYNKMLTVGRYFGLQ